MSNKLFSMLELSSKGFPHNKFYVLDLKGVKPDEIESFFRDGLRNFRSLINCRYVCVRSGFSGKPEAKLFLATNIDYDNDELIIAKMKEALVFFSSKLGGYSDGFIILQEWTPDEDYFYSINLMPLGSSYIIEAVKGDHFKLDRAEQSPTVIRLMPNNVDLIKPGLAPDDLVLVSRHVTNLLNNYFFEDNCVYEFSFIKDRPSFYQIKRPGKLYKEPLNKQNFYQQLSDNNIPFESKILRKL